MCSKANIYFNVIKLSTWLSLNTAHIVTKLKEKLTQQFIDEGILSTKRSWKLHPFISVYLRVGKSRT